MKFRKTGGLVVSTLGLIGLALCYIIQPADQEKNSNPEFTPPPTNVGSSPKIYTADQGIELNSIVITYNNAAKDEPEQLVSKLIIMHKDQIIQTYEAGKTNFTVEKILKNNHRLVAFISFLIIINPETRETVIIPVLTRFEINQEMYELLRQKGFREVKIIYETIPPAPIPDKDKTIKHAHHHPSSSFRVAFFFPVEKKGNL